MRSGSYSVEEVAEKLGVDYIDICNLVREGKIVLELKYQPGFFQCYTDKDIETIREDLCMTNL